MYKKQHFGKLFFLNILKWIFSLYFKDHNISYGEESSHDINLTILIALLRSTCVSSIDRLKLEYHFFQLILILYSSSNLNLAMSDAKD